MKYYYNRIKILNINKAVSMRIGGIKKMKNVTSSLDIEPI